MRSTWKWLMPVSVLALACCWPGLAPAATIDWYASGFNSQSMARAENPAAVPDRDDSGTHVDWNNTYASTIPYAHVTDVEALSFNYGDGSGNSPGNHRNVDVYASVEGNSTVSGSVLAAGEAFTVTPTVTDGIFFLINPSPGEHVGDPVTLSWNWGGRASTGAGTTAKLTGGYFADMTITLNDYPVPSGPTPGKTIWSYAGQELSAFEYFEEYDSGEHLASIGDIIGVHLGAFASIEFIGVGYHDAFSTQQLSLYVDTLPVPIPGAVWLLGTGLIGLTGLRRKLKR